MKKVLAATAALMLLSASAASARVPAFNGGAVLGGQTATGGPSGAPSQGG